MILILFKTQILSKKIFLQAGFYNGINGSATS